MIGGKSITNTTTELHTVIRLQPSEVKPVRVHPDLQKESVVQQHSQRGIEPQVNGMLF